MIIQDISDWKQVALRALARASLGIMDFWLDSGKTFAKSLDSFAIEFAEHPISKSTLTNFPTFKVDLLRTVCGSVCLSIEKMTSFANTFDVFLPFYIVEY